MRRFQNPYEVAYIKEVQIVLKPSQSVNLESRTIVIALTGVCLFCPSRWRSARGIAEKVRKAAPGFHIRIMGEDEILTSIGKRLESEQ